MIGGNARRDIPVQALAARIGSVAVDHFPKHARRFQLAHRFGIFEDDAGIVHKFAEAVNKVLFEVFFGIRAREDGTARFERSGRHTGRKHDLRFQRRIFDGIGDILRACNAANVGDLMRVSNDRRRAAGQHEFGKFFGGKLRAFNMDVSVDQAGDGDLPRDVVFRFPFVRTEADDLAPFKSNIAAANFARKDIDEFAVLQNDFRLFVPDGGVDVFFQHG